MFFDASNYTSWFTQILLPGLLIATSDLVIIMKSSLLSLKLGFWNVQKIDSRKNPKLSDEEFLSLLQQNDIIGLGETQTDVEFEVPGYRTFCKSRKKAKKGRKSGGLAFLVKNEIYKGCHIVRGTAVDALWLKLDHHFFNTTKDIFLCVVYFSPHRSSFTLKLDYCPFQQLEHDIEKFSKLGEVILGGDFNARTTTQPDFIPGCSVDGNNLTNLSTSSQFTVHDDLRPRCNQDTGTNPYGPNLLSMCQSHYLRILNGRKPGDSLGYFTCFEYNGSSAVDYILVKPSLFDSVLYFNVGDLTPFSDHCMVTCCLLLSDLMVSSPKNSSSSSRTNSCHLSPPPVKFIWEAESGPRFTKSLQHPSIKSKITEFLTCDNLSSQTDIDKAVKDISDIFNSAASSSLKKKFKPGLAGKQKTKGL